MNKEKEQELLEVVKNNYEAIAQEFDATRKKALWPILLELAGRVQNGQRVLDVGCGNGRLLKAFNGKEIQFVGTDQSVGLIEAALANSQAFGGTITSQFLVSDILNLQDDVQGEFDWVFSIAVIHHLPSKELRLRALRNLKSKLKPGGTLIISVWRPWGDKKLVREQIKTIWNKIRGEHPYAWNDLVFNWKDTQSKRYYHFFTLWELKRLIRGAGLHLVENHSEKRNYYLVLK